MRILALPMQRREPVLAARLISASVRLNVLAASLSVMKRS